MVNRPVNRRHSCHSPSWPSLPCPVVGLCISAALQFILHATPPLLHILLPGCLPSAVQRRAPTLVQLVDRQMLAECKNKSISFLFIRQNPAEMPLPPRSLCFIELCILHCSHRGWVHNAAILFSSLRMLVHIFLDLSNFHLLSLLCLFVFLF